MGLTAIDESLRLEVSAAVDAEIVAVAPVHGGDVAVAYRVDLADGRRVFVKTHRAPPPGFFTTEATGLAWLRSAQAVSVPEVLFVSDGDGQRDPGDSGDGRGDGDAVGAGDGVAASEPGRSTQTSDRAAGPPRAMGTRPAFLVLAWIERGAPVGLTEVALGRDLAALHAAGAPCFGREDRRTTGSRALPNEPTDRWSDFYAENRLLPLARLALAGGALAAHAIDALERLATRLDEVGGSDEPPARLHGDLWAGNRLVDSTGESWLIDPAAHGGHREFDLAMMRLFGGFGPDCFAAYDEVHPLADGWEDRIALHQIAPLVVHAIKFGGSYGPAAEQAIARYS